MNAFKKAVAAAVVAAAGAGLRRRPGSPLKIGVVIVPVRRGRGAVRRAGEERRRDRRSNMLNAGKVPAPYATKGFGGSKMENLVLTRRAARPRRSPSSATWCSATTSIW